MNLTAVMDEIGAALDTIAGLRVHPYEADRITPPAALVSYPTITFDATYGRGADTWELDVVILAGKASSRAARATLAPYVTATGGSSVKAVLESHDWASLDDLTVSDCDFATVTVAGVDYLAAVFTASIIGPGGA